MCRCSMTPCHIAPFVLRALELRKNGLPSAAEQGLSQR